MTLWITALLIGAGGITGGYCASRKRKNRYVRISIDTVKHRMAMEA